jgi:hypothetical protein
VRAMRWPLWRGRRDAAPAQTTAGEAAADAVPPGYPSRAAWRTAAPLLPTVSLTPPTLLPPGLPEVTGTRSLLHRRPVAATADPQLPVPLGRVAGLATAVSVPVTDAAAEPPRPALAHPPARILPSQERQPRTELVRATDDYVGEPRVPDQPHRAPGWLRALSQAPSFEPIPGLPAALAAMPIMPAPEPSAPAVPRPPAPRPALPAGGPPPAQPPLPVARPPRRAGLGPPIVPPVPVMGPDLPGGPPPAGSARGSGRTGTVRARARGGLGPPLLPAPPTPPTPPGQRSAREPAPQPPAEEEPEPAVAVPTEVTQAMRAAYGVEVGEVPVRSGPDAQREAEDRRARAFAADDEVVLGPTPGGDAARRALIAHELVHLVQQRELGGALPDEQSPAGRALEADAVAAEHAVLTGRSLPPLRHRPLGGPPPGTVRAVAGRVQRAPLAHPDTTTTTPTGTGQDTAHPTPTSTPSTPHTAPGTGTSQRSTVDDDPWRLRGDAHTRWGRLGEVVEHDLAGLVGSSWGIDVDQLQALQGGGGTGGGRGAGGTGGGTGGPGRHGRHQDDDPWRLRGDAHTRWGRLGDVVEHDLAGIMATPWGIDIDQVEQQQSGTGPGTHTGGATGGTAHGDGAHPDAHGGAGGQGGAGGMGPAVHTDPSRPLSHTGRPQIDTDDLDLDEIAVRLYDRLRSRLRMELLLDRERAGLLTDFR